MLYAKRWGIETSFRALKYTVGLIHLHSRKSELVLQEIFAAFTVFNFTQAAVWAVDTARGKSKYDRCANFSHAVFLCCEALRWKAEDITGLLERTLRPVTADYSFLNPNVEITVSHHASKGDAILEEADFLLCYGQDSQTFWEKSGTWISQELFQEPCYPLISKRYCTYPKDCEELSILDVKDDFFAVMWDGSFLTSDLAFKICQASGFVPKVTVKTNNLIFKLGIAGEGRAVAIVPESCARTAQQLYADLCMFRIAEAATQRPVYLLRKKKLLASEAARDFWNFVLEYYDLDPDERD